MSFAACGQWFVSIGATILSGNEKRNRIGSMKIGKAQHNSFWRRFRRRFPYYLPIYAFGALEAGIKAANLIAVLRPEWIGPCAANAARLLWLCGNLVTILLCLLPLLPPHPKSAFAEAPPEILHVRSTKQRAFHYVLSIVTIAVAAMLLMGRTDIALIVAFGGWGIAGLIDAIRARTCWNLPALVLRMTVAAAIPIRSLGLAAIGLAGCRLASIVIKPSVLSVLRSKPTAAEYMERQEILRARGLPFTQSQRVYVLIEMRKWEEALRVLDGIPQDETFPAEKRQACRARIVLHLGAYEKVTETTAEAATSCSIQWKCAVALAYVRLNEVDRALEIVQELKTRHGRFMGHAELEALGEIYHALGAHETALTYYERLLRRMSSRAALPIADVLMDLGEFREARRFYETGLCQAKFRRAGDLRKLAACYRQLHDEERARMVEELAAKS